MFLATRATRARQAIRDPGDDLNWYAAMRSRKRKELDKITPMGTILVELKRVKARMPAKVEQPFWVFNFQVGNQKLHYRRLH